MTDTWHDKLTRLAIKSIYLVGSAEAFGVVFLLLALWLIGGLFVGYNNELYQFIANTPLSWASLIVTIAVLISTQRESRALHMKVDELIRAVAEARNDFRGIEKAEEATLDRLEQVAELAPDEPPP